VLLAAETHLVLAASDDVAQHSHGVSVLGLEFRLVDVHSQRLLQSFHGSQQLAQGALGQRRALAPEDLSMGQVAVHKPTAYQTVTPRNVGT
jgi:hypothetical protein